MSLTCGDTISTRMPLLLLISLILLLLSGSRTGKGEADWLRFLRVGRCLGSLEGYDVLYVIDRCADCDYVDLLSSSKFLCWVKSCVFCDILMHLTSLFIRVRFIWRRSNFVTGWRKDDNGWRKNDKRLASTHVITMMETIPRAKESTPLALFVVATSTYCCCWYPSL